MSDLSFTDEAPRRRGNRPVAAPPDREVTARTKRVRVLHPFQVVHDTVVHRPGEVAEIPESVAAEWIMNRWVTEDFE